MRVKGKRGGVVVEGGEEEDRVGRWRGERRRRVIGGQRRRREDGGVGGRRAREGRREEGGSCVEGQPLTSETARCRAVAPSTPAAEPEEGCDSSLDRRVAVFGPRLAA